MTRLLLIITLLVASRATAGQVELTLRTSARIAFDQPVLAGDVATIVGPGAEAMGRQIVLAASDARSKARSGWLEITTEDLQQALTARDSRFIVRGAVCRVRLMPAVETTSQKPADVERPIVAAPGISLQQHIESRLAAHWQVKPVDLRLEFDERDARLLAEPTAGRVIEVLPMGSGATMPVGISIYEEDRIAKQASIRVGVQIRREVVRAVEPVARREVLASKHISVEHAWTAPGDQIAAAADVVGSETRVALKPGEVITVRDIEAPVVVRQGDEVTVRCITGSIIVRQIARSMGTARDGERVLLRPAGGGRPYYARMNGRGKAVYIASDDAHASEAAEE